ncbi:hypothetical protein AYO36_15870 [Exiguobacterium sp. KKBO11]|uniref:hypothetical protein n=1 Tax=Exiguobacterium sp. KKBO11 TaxID=1805000 RepID=UPI0007D7B514|nr:hypothetical protein [Exiguobacterium sp. KKBO11]OAI82162.1 hypothetical protein AYO36_15870 [Exiguobacterium sp. KKBO11]
MNPKKLSKDLQNEIEEIYNMTFTYENLSQIHVREVDRSKECGSIKLMYFNLKNETVSTLDYQYDEEEETFERRLIVSYLEGDWSTLIDQKLKGIDPEDLLDDLKSVFDLMTLTPY